MEEKIRRIYVPMTETGFYILFCLQTPQHGYGIGQQVAMMTGNAVTISPGTMYGTLSKMEKDGLIAFYAEDQKRKLYQITDLGREVVYGAQPNWLAIDSLTGPMEVTVRLRHSRTEQEAVLSSDGEGIRLDMKTPARAPTPGQLAVFYDGDTVLGSAWIT